MCSVLNSFHVLEIDLAQWGGCGGGITSYIWYSMDVCAEWPLNSALPGIYDQLPFFFNKVHD